METSDSKFKSVKDSANNSEKEIDTSVNSRNDSSRPSSEDSSTIDLANKSKHSNNMNDSQNLCVKEYNKNKNTKEHHSSLLQNESKEKSDFENEESKFQNIEGEQYNDGKTEHVHDDDNHGCFNENSPSSNGDDEFVCQVVDEDSDSTKNEVSSVSTKEGSEYSICEEDSQHTISDASELVVHSEDTGSTVKDETDSISNDGTDSIMNEGTIGITDEGPNNIMNEGTNNITIEDTNNIMNEGPNSRASDDADNRASDAVNNIVNEKNDVESETLADKDFFRTSPRDDQSNMSNDSVYCEIQSDDDAAATVDDDSDTSSQSIKKEKVMQSAPEKNLIHESEPSPKRQKLVVNNDDESVASISTAYTKNIFIEELSSAFQDKKAKEYVSGARIINEPFTCCVLPSFIEPEYFVCRLKEELVHVKMTEKLNDLYQFKSKDMDDSQEPNISAFKRLLSEECLLWMRRITNIPLTEKVDISCASYTLTDHLLCHDDELEGRRIAFIFYLVPPDWDEKDGGGLDLFTSVDGQPSEIHTSFSPRWNNFIFFEVSPVSFHQVSEVLSTKNRLSISGWFHGPPLNPSIPRKEKLLFHVPTDVEIDVTKWINPMYFDHNTQLNIREIFEETCEISLPDFFQVGKYEEVCKALLDCGIDWKRKGPYNKRNFHEVADVHSVHPVLQECKSLFSSKAFFVILSNLTALDLYSEDACKTGKVYSCIRKWGPGSYTLLHDQSFAEEYSVNVIMYFNCSDWNTDCGGYTSYVAIEENEELLQIDPKPNLLGVVYITEGTSNFVKYINSQANKQALPFFHDIYSMYIENQ